MQRQWFTAAMTAINLLLLLLTLANALPHPRRDGSTHLLLDPLELIEKLSVLIPPPRFHLLRFHGVLAPRAQLRSAVVPRSSRNAELGGGQAPGRLGERRLGFAGALCLSVSGASVRP